MGISPVARQLNSRGFNSRGLGFASAGLRHECGPRAFTAIFSFTAILSRLEAYFLLVSAPIFTALVFPALYPQEAAAQWYGRNFSYSHTYGQGSSYSNIVGYNSGSFRASSAPFPGYFHSSLSGSEQQRLRYVQAANNYKQQEKSWQETKTLIQEGKISSRAAYGRVVLAAVTPPKLSIVQAPIPQQQLTFGGIFGSDEEASTKPTPTPKASSTAKQASLDALQKSTTSKKAPSLGNETLDIPGIGRDKLADLESTKDAARVNREATTKNQNPSAKRGTSSAEQASREESREEEDSEQKSIWGRLRSYFGS